MKKNDYSIVAKGLKKSFGKLIVLDGVDIKVKRGTILALLGPNGAGKTTTVRIMATLLKADGGSVTIEGHDVSERPDKVRSVIGLTGQYAAVDEYLTGRENLRMIGRLYHLGKADVIRRTEELLEQFDLVEAADRTAKTYSGGMRRRLDLAASLIATPPVIFLDEPTTGLDPRSRLNLWDNIEKLAAEGTTILLTTQHLEEADRLANSIAVIDGGKVIAEGTADELKDKVGRERIQFTLETDADLKKAIKLVDGETLQVDEKRKSLSVVHDSGVYKLKDILEKFEKSKIRVANMSLAKPTLDDVFLQLTGHKATAENNNENGGKK